MCSRMAGLGDPSEVDALCKNMASLSNKILKFRVDPKKYVFGFMTEDVPIVEGVMQGLAPCGIIYGMVTFTRTFGSKTKPILEVGDRAWLVFDVRSGMFSAFSGPDAGVYYGSVGLLTMQFPNAKIRPGNYVGSFIQWNPHSQE